MHKQILGLLASAAVLAGPAAAGEMAMRDSYSAKSDWSGAYVGFNLGGGQLKADTTRDVTSTTYFALPDEAAVELASLGSLDDDVFTAGFLAGYNWDIGWGVAGLEADFNAASTSLALSAFSPYVTDPTESFYATTEIDQDWFGSVRARLGVELGGSLLYATGGLAVADIEMRQTFRDTVGADFISVSRGETLTGWTAGGGVEVPVFGSTTLKVEYLYSDLGSTSVPATALPGTTDGFSAGSADLTHQTVRAGMNWRLN